MHIVKIECADEVGLVHRITGCFCRYGLNIVANGEFVDPDRQRFFMRAEVDGPLDAEQLRVDLCNSLPSDSTVEVLPSRPKRIVVMVSKEPHCLGDILVRCEFGEIQAELLAVIGNHERLRGLVEHSGFPYHCVPHEGLSREEHEDQVRKVLDPYEPEYVVLAKYMRILTPSIVRDYRGRLINIHHSFLPAFIGANPYKQAYQRGVKIIGATAHFVTDELDEGAIIAQDVTQVMHQHSAKQMSMAGRNVEKHVLNRALYLVFGDRVFISGNKTIIFE